MKNFDTKPGKLVSEEPEETLPDATGSENPTEITDPEARATTPGEQNEQKTTEQTGVIWASAATEETEVTIPEVEPEVAPLPAPKWKGSASRAKRSASARSEVPVADKESREENELKHPPVDVPQGSRWFSREHVLAWAPYAAVILLGAILRFWGLGDKPLHHDESLHAYFSLGLLHNLQHWGWCLGWNNAPAGYSCYTYDPLLHGPFQFHAIALVYQISQWLGAPDNGVNTTTVRLVAALLGTALLFLPYLLRDYLGKLGSWITTFLLAVSPSMVYFSRFAREDIYMAFFTLLLVVATGRYIRERKIQWILLASAGFALSYATSEATFLTIAIFGSFLGALVVWEIGMRFPFTLHEHLREDLQDSLIGRLHPRTFGPLVVLLYFIVLGIAAKFFFNTLDTMAAYINNPATQAQANTDLSNVEATTLKVIPWLGILLGLYVFSILAREIYGKLPLPNERAGLARLVSRRQPVLDTILSMPWTHWFFALILGWAIFLLLFTVIFTNIGGGIGDGIWRGLYYWLQQQNVDRGGQPWYYYLLLIPLYEQVGLVFAVAGIIRIVRRPNQFRLFLVYWFLGNLFIYSWAGEKMPWLMIFMTMPMMLLAAVGLEPCVLASYHFIRQGFFSRTSEPIAAESEEKDTLTLAPRTYSHINPVRAGLGLFGVVMALLLLAPTLHNMYEVTYIHPADGPYEMMVYVQTTNDINTLMAHVDEIDRKDFGGNHQMRIGVAANATWPFAWYLRDYPNLCFNYPSACPTWKNTVPVVITAIDDTSDAFPPASTYLSHPYVMRSWWDEGYKLPACPQGQKPSIICSDPNLGSGVGPLPWLNYGDNPPPNAPFNPILIMQRVWNWWWNRVPFGSTNGGYGMNLFVQKGLGVNP